MYLLIVCLIFPYVRSFPLNVSLIICPLSLCSRNVELELLNVSSHSSSVSPWDTFKYNYIGYPECAKAVSATEYYDGGVQVGERMSEEMSEEERNEEQHDKVERWGYFGIEVSSVGLIQLI